jgi:phosphatidylinositol dimannoside acyltransferase
VSTAALTSRTRDAVSVFGFRLGWSALRAMPERAAYALFDRIADAVVLRGGKGLGRLRSNYARVRPELGPAELDDLVHDGMRSYLRYYCEAFRLPSLRPEQIDRAVVASGTEAASRVCRDGGTAIAFVGHLGNFDMAAAWSARHVAPVTTVAERLKPEAVFQEFVAFRNSIDMDIIPLTGGDDPFRELLRTARAGGRLIALASDRDLTANGVEVDLCGRPARMAKGPAVLSLATGAPLHAAAIWYEPAPRGTGLGGHRTVIEMGPALVPRIDGPTEVLVQDLTQQCADHLARAIREHTSSWHMLQRVFSEDLSPLRSRA